LEIDGNPQRWRRGHGQHRECVAVAEFRKRGDSGRVERPAATSDPTNRPRSVSVATTTSEKPIDRH
jgi:hypothetical protein